MDKLKIVVGIFLSMLGMTVAICFMSWYFLLINNYDLGLEVVANLLDPNGADKLLVVGCLGGVVAYLGLWIVGGVLKKEDDVFLASFE